MQIRRPLSAAISWTILAEVIRRHGHAGNLRVIEMHPGGGMYDLLVLARANATTGEIYNPFSEVGSINLYGGTIRGIPGSSKGVGILNAWMGCDDPKNVVTVAEREMGFPPSSGLAKSNRWTFGPRVFAALLGSQMAQRDYLDARMSFLDTSGYGGGIDAALEPFTAICAIDRQGVPDDRTERAALCWSLLAGSEGKLVGIFRMDGLLSPVGHPDQVHDLFAAYRKSRSLSEVVALAVKILGL